MAKNNKNETENNNSNKMVTVKFLLHVKNFYCQNIRISVII